MVCDIPDIPRTALNDLFVEIAVAAKQDKENRRIVTSPKTTMVNGATGKFSKGPSANELDSIKAQVLGKLCGRNPIPLSGKPAERAESVVPSSRF